MIQRHSCGSVGIEPPPAPRAGRKSEQTSLGKEEQGRRARVNRRWERGVGRRGQACQPADANGLGGDRNGFLMLSFCSRWFSVSVRRDVGICAGCTQTSLAGTALGSGSVRVSENLGPGGAPWFSWP